MIKKGPNTCLAQTLLKEPDSILVRYFFGNTQPKKALKAKPIQYLKFGIFFTEIIVLLQN
ncbi:MAG: hypothetical protein ACJAT5_000254 [Lentimonas sp.]|jgi:hypothetical protein